MLARPLSSSKRSFQSTPPSTGGDTQLPRASAANIRSFQSTPPSTGGDTAADVRRHRDGPGVSIHAAFNRRRHHRARSKEESRPHVSIHAAFNRRRHAGVGPGDHRAAKGFNPRRLQQAATRAWAPRDRPSRRWRFNPRRLQQAANTGLGPKQDIADWRVSIHAAFNRRRHSGSGFGCGSSSGGFNPRRLQQAATRDLIAPATGGTAVSIHAAFNRRRHTFRRWLLPAVPSRFNPRRLQQAATPAPAGRSRTPVRSFQSTPPSTGGDTAGGPGSTTRFCAFQSTPPSTGGDTHVPDLHRAGAVRRFNPRRLQQAATLAMTMSAKIVNTSFQSTPPSTGGDTCDVVPRHQARHTVSIHAAFNRRRHARRRVARLPTPTCFNPRRLQQAATPRAPAAPSRSGGRFNPRRLQQAATLGQHAAGEGVEQQVSIHAAFNRRRHPRGPSCKSSPTRSFNPRRLQQAATREHSTSVSEVQQRVSIHAAFNRRRHLQDGAKGSGDDMFQSTPPSTGGDTLQGVRYRQAHQEVSIHAAFNRRRHTRADPWAAGSIWTFQSTPPSTGGDTRAPGSAVRCPARCFNPRRLQQAATHLSQGQIWRRRPCFNPRRLQQAATLH